MNYQKYQKAYSPVPLTKRSWPDREITSAPTWCSVDLRDGNQALFSPMMLEEKVEFFNFLVDLGFKEIEIGFPAASETEYQFTRHLIENNLIPDDVTIQVLTQSREHIIRKTVEAIKGAKNVIIHFYNSTSELQRRVVFHMEKQEIIDLAISGAKLLKELEEELDGNIRYEYSPESFTCTEMEFAAEICNAVIDELEPSPDKKLIINLPSTIEVSTPNIFADQIEYMSNHLKRRDAISISVHAHNDRGTGVAATELALLAGADRVEGTLFGNGERTGNADIVVIALNMFSMGIDPKLELGNITKIAEVFKKFNKLPIHPRQPYAGQYAYTAFSGSHQDAIKKSMDYYKSHDAAHWQNPYLPIDPSDLQRNYEPIQINSQSGKGGVDYIMETKFGYSVPKQMLQHFSSIIKRLSDDKHTVMEPQEIYEAFKKEYVNLDARVKLNNYTFHVDGEKANMTAKLSVHGVEHEISKSGNGPLDAMTNILREATGRQVEIVSYTEHALEGSSTSKAVSYIALSNPNGEVYWGAGVHENINTSSILALFSAMNKMI
ncbi:MAG: 2-isopropylmalate synthase [Clostridia bacterium]|nr:2-isopropylmalate synthase [Clostridia bacterium]